MDHTKWRRNQSQPTGRRHRPILIQDQPANRTWNCELHVFYECYHNLAFLWKVKVWDIFVYFIMRGNFIITYQRYVLIALSCIKYKLSWCLLLLFKVYMDFQLNEREMKLNYKNTIKKSAFLRILLFIYYDIICYFRKLVKLCD